MSDDFRTSLKALGLTGRGFALLTGVHEETVTGWGRTRSGRGVQEVPLWAWLLLDAWAAHPGALKAARASPRLSPAGVPDLERTVRDASKRWSPDIAA